MKTRISKRTVRYSSAVVVAVVLNLALAGPIIDGSSVCERADEWARSYADRVPLGYTEILELPRGYRRNVFARLPPASQAHIVRTHYQQALADRQDLSLEQRRILEEFIGVTVPSLYSGESRLPDDLVQRANKAFVSSAHRAILTSLSRPSEPLPRSWRTTKARLTEALRTAWIASAQTHDCDCFCTLESSGWEDCRWIAGFPYCTANTGCRMWPTGCGPSMTFPCDGLCCNGLEYCACT